MGRSIPWLWIGLAALVLFAPGPLGRLLLDLLGGLTLLILLLPVLLAGGGWIAWRLLRSRLKVCPSCGTATLASDRCLACGASLTQPPAAGTVSWEPFASPSRAPGMAEFLQRFGVVPLGAEADHESKISDFPPQPDAGHATIDIQSRPVLDE